MSDTPKEVTAESRPSNERVLLVKSMVRLMSRVEIVEGYTSGSGKTISVENERGKTIRLKSEKIFGGDSEFRSSYGYKLYSKDELSKRERANYTGGAPVAGHGKLTHENDMPTPTHVAV